MNSVEPDLCVSLLTPYLTDKSRRLMFSISVDNVKSFEKLKTALLRKHRLTPFAYRLNFYQATRRGDES